MTAPTFKADRACPKCGGLAGQRYMREPAKVDWVVRTCGRCGYEWDEVPLDRAAETALNERFPAPMRTVHHD